MPQITATGRGRGLTGTPARQVRTSAIRALQGDAMMIYAVLLNDGLVKIGASRDVPRRLTQLRRGGGVKQVLALKPGSRADELAIHRGLKGHAVEGREWYLPTPSVMRVVNEMRAPLGLEPVVFERRFAS